MKLKLIIVFCLIALCATAQSERRTYQSVEGDPMATRIYTLDNGLKVYLSVNKEKPRIQTYIAVRTGSRNDPAETTGLAHYLEHLMFKGTKRFGTSDAEKEAPLLDTIQDMYEAYRTMTDTEQRKAQYHRIDSVSQLAARYNIPNEYDKLMAAIGSEGSNAYTSNDVTCYVEDIPANEVENWARIQSDRFQNMVIRGFHTELESVYEEYNMGLTRDNNKMWEAMKLFLRNAWNQYGDEHDTLGLDEVSRAEARAIFDEVERGNAETAEPEAQQTAQSGTPVTTIMQGRIQAMIGEPSYSLRLAKSVARWADKHLPETGATVWEALGALPTDDRFPCPEALMFLRDWLVTNPLRVFQMTGPGLADEMVAVATAAKILENQPRPCRLMEAIQAWGHGWRG